MKNGSAFEKRQLARKNRLRLRRQHKRHELAKHEMGGGGPGSSAPTREAVEKSRGQEYHRLQEKKAQRNKRRAEQSFKKAEDLVRSKGRKKT